MADILLSNQEPGFYSNVEVSEELSVNPTGQQVLAIIGTGSATKATSIVAAKGAEYIDPLADGTPAISSISRVAPVGGFAFAPASYSPAVSSGSMAVAPILPADPVLSFNLVDPTGAQADQAVNLALNAGAITAFQLVNSINAGAATKNLVRAVAEGLGVYIYSKDGRVVVMGNTAANIALGFTAGQKPAALAWNYDQEIVSINAAAFSHAANTLNNLKLKFTIEGDLAPVEYVCAVGVGVNLIAIPDLVADFNTFSVDNALGISAYEIAGAVPKIAFIASGKRKLMLHGAAEGTDLVPAPGTVYLNTRLGFDAGTTDTPADDINSAISTRLFPDGTILTPADAGMIPYQIDYQTDKVAADFAPKRVTTKDGASTLFGDFVPANMLSMGCFAAFSEGAEVIYGVQLNPANVTDGVSSVGEMQRALDALKGYDVDLVIPMEPITTNTTKSIKYLQHVSEMSSLLNRRERMCVLAGDETAGIKTVEQWLALIAPFAPSPDTAIMPKRVVVVYPGVASVTPADVTYTLNGSFSAAAFAGRMANPAYDEATSMTRKTLTSVEGLFTPELLRVDKNALSNAGITVLERPNGVTVVRRSISTDLRTIPSQEPSITRSFDRVAREMRDGLEAAYVGASIIPGLTKSSIKATAETYLDNLQGISIIGGYQNVKVEPAAGEPRQFNVSFEASPIYPLLWGYINITITL
jgi:hypothetical protein